VDAAVERASVGSTRRGTRRARRTPRGRPWGPPRAARRGTYLLGGEARALANAGWEERNRGRRVAGPVEESMEIKAARGANPLKLNRKVCEKGCLSLLLRGHNHSACISIQIQHKMCSIASRGSTVVYPSCFASCGFVITRPTVKINCVAESGALSTTKRLRAGDISSIER